jgi:hypothetical protein
MLFAYPITLLLVALAALFAFSVLTPRSNEAEVSTTVGDFEEVH